MNFLAINNAQVLTDFVQTNKAMHKTRAQIKLFAQIPLIFVRCKISMHKTCLYLTQVSHIHLSILVSAMYIS